MAKQRIYLPSNVTWQLENWAASSSEDKSSKRPWFTGTNPKPTLGPACMVLISTDVLCSTALYEHPHGPLRDKQKLNQDCSWEGEGVHTSPRAQSSLQIMKCWKPPSYTILLGNVTSRKAITDISSMWQSAKRVCLLFPLNVRTSLWNKRGLFLCLCSYITLRYRSQELS